MVKILHAADFHLDSAFGSLPEEKARQRRRESRETVERLVDFANEQGVELLLLAGDLFDSDRLYGETGEQLCRALRRFGGQTVIAPGNHDWYTARGAYARLPWPENVHLFTGMNLNLVLSLLVEHPEALTGKDIQEIISDAQKGIRNLSGSEEIQPDEF